MFALILPIIALSPKINAFCGENVFYNNYVVRDRMVTNFSKIIDVEILPDDGSDSSGGRGSIATNADPQLSLIEYSQKQDPDWKSMPVAFCDTVSNTYIDCNLAFYIKDPLGRNGLGAEYSLGVPCEVPVVVALEIDDMEVENGDGAKDDAAAAVANLSKVIPINPETTDEAMDNISEDEKSEIFQMAARALMDEFGSGIRLKKTPRVLTLEGDLDEVIGDWKEVLLGTALDGDNMSFEDAVNLFENDNNDEEDYFDKIMRRDLGPDYMKLSEEDNDDIDEELLKLFDPDSMNKDGDLSNVIDFLRNGGYSNKIDNDFEKLVQQLKPSAALRLLNFMTEDGKEYTILRPVRPMLLLGKEDPDDYTRRILLTDEEMAEVLPRLENVCRESLEKAGFFLADGSKD